MSNCILISKIDISDANALSSPYSVGFPAITGLMGFVQKFELLLHEQEEYKEIKFISAGIVSNKFYLHTTKVGYDNRICLFKSPLKSNGSLSSIVESPKCSMQVSILIECENIGLIDIDVFVNYMEDILWSKLKFAGGSIFKPYGNDSKYKHISFYEKKDNIILRKMMPGYALIERRDLMVNSMEEGKDAIESLLHYVKINHQNDNISKNSKGWIVPITTGYQGISDFAVMENQRSYEYQHRFVENIVTLCEFVMPYRLDSVDNLLWHYDIDLNKNLYTFKQNKPFFEEN
jgi:CRISPR-associated protein Csy2